MLLHSLSTFALLTLLSLPLSAIASVAYCNNQDYESGALGESPYQSYNAAPFQPVQLNYALPTADCPSNSQVSGYFMISPLGTGLHMTGGGYIMNPNGTMVYFSSGFGSVVILRGVFTYQGEDHLGIWVSDGSIPTPSGHGSGWNILLDRSYNTVATITTSGLSVGADLHELHITSNNTAIITAYPTDETDLSAYGGSTTGYVLNPVAQEIDIATGEAIFTWKALDHVSPSECYAPFGTTSTGYGTATDPWDYFHMNSIQKNDDGTYLISSRHCHTLYLVNSAGEILWRMGGKNSNFTLNEGANFTWQHHARFRGSGQLSLFDNGATEWEQDIPYSQGLLLDYDESAMTVSLLSARAPYDRTNTVSQGSVELLSDGTSVVGWGAMPYFSGHDTDGNIIWSAQFAVASSGIASYRVFLNDWTGRPSTPPSHKVTSPFSGNITVYAWWNGATEVASWELLGSRLLTPLKATSLSNASKTDFETTLVYSGSGYAYYQVAALNANGQVLKYSNFTALDGTTFGPADNQTVTAAPLS
ncbi:ASST-domain-containing protein [Lentinula lateritia]|uniref:ASST-domain-containing protein n=1 Tax=Lentinula lateritia TaxID=40482 RepID=A0ABQ8VT16_9AGAR|nr:ASST-domain-containing protein [Lentinula lateritia]